VTLFADMSNESIVAVLTFGYVVLKFVEKVYDDWRLSTAARVVAEHAAAAAQEVKVALMIGDQKKQDHLNAQDASIRVLGDQLHQVVGDVHEVKAQTNGMLAKLEDASFQKGVKSETDKTDPLFPPGTH
jgi:hypothetical protein